MKNQDLCLSSVKWLSYFLFLSLLYSWVVIHSTFPECQRQVNGHLKKKRKGKLSAPWWLPYAKAWGRSCGLTHEWMGVVVFSNASWEVGMLTYIEKSVSWYIPSHEKFYLTIAYEQSSPIWVTQTRNTQSESALLYIWHHFNLMRKIFPDWFHLSPIVAYFPVVLTTSSFFWSHSLIHINVLIIEIPAEHRVFFPYRWK